MHSKKVDFGGSRDLISGLPDALNCHILSSLPTKEAASTSLLSKRWKHLLAFIPNLEFDDSIYMHPRASKEEMYEIHTSFIDFHSHRYHYEERKNTSSKSFMAFVDSVLALQSKALLKRFQLKCEDAVHPGRVFEWVPIVLEPGVLDLDLNISSSWDDYSGSGYYPLPSEIFVSKTLVRLKIGVKDGVSLPKLRNLHLENVSTENSMFAKLLAGCSELEELVLNNLMWDWYEPFSVYSTTLKTLKLCRFEDSNESSESMPLDIQDEITSDSMVLFFSSSE